MRREVIGKCPVCGDELKVTKLSCSSCDTHIEGNFDLCKFCKLSNEQKSFLEAFVRNRGNIKEIEKDLSISYPTVKNKLEDLVQALGYSSKYSEPEIDKKDILERLNNGEITSEEALKLLKN
ncbi:MAG: DUF2089 domain-containing protein [Tissierellaceae bacterium]|nr:DUF2089 domain-containing protein [Tissierellaceae bacterium]